MWRNAGVSRSSIVWFLRFLVFALFSLEKRHKRLAITCIWRELFDRVMRLHETEDEFLGSLLTVQGVDDELPDKGFSSRDRTCLSSLRDADGLAQLLVEELFEVLRLFRTPLLVPGFPWLPLARLRG